MSIIICCRRTMVVALASVVLLFLASSVIVVESFAPTAASSATKSSESSTAVFYRNPQDSFDDPALLEESELGAAAPPPAKETIKPKNKKKKLTIVKKPTIYSISTLDELQYFLEEEDDRLTVIKFYAPWCKSCQRLGQHYTKLARRLGDGVDRNRHKVRGEIRFVEIRYGDETRSFVMHQLQVKQVPTLQLYHGLHKIWQESGMKNTMSLQQTIEDLPTDDPIALAEYAAEVDDGILETAIDDAFFDSPSFLDEEW